MNDRAHPSERVYLGCVQHLSRSYEGPFFARVTPLLRSNVEGTVWEGAIKDLTGEFPDRGEVFWWDIPNSFAQGDYVQFRLRVAQGYDPPEKPEKFQVSDPQVPIEVLDLRAWSETHLRRQLTGKGVYVQRDPLVRMVMIWFDAERWVGPVHLVPGEDSDLWKLAEKEDLSSLQCFAPPRSVLRTVQISGTRLLLPPTLERGEHAGFRNWMPDTQLAGNLLQRIRHYDRKAFDALGVTYRVFDTYLEVLEQAGLRGPDLARYVAKKERVEALRASLAANRELLEETVSTVLDMPEVRAEIEQRKQALFEEARAEQSARVAEELQAEEEKLQATRRQVEAVQQQVDDVNAQLAQKEVDLAQAVASFEARVRERLQELVGTPEKAFAEFVVLRGLLGPALGGGTLAVEPVPVEPPPSGGAARSSARILQDTKEVVASIGRALRERGLPPPLARELHSAFVAGATPILAGASAYESLSAYAGAVTGGNLVWIPVSASVFEPQDLLGRFDATQGRIVPHPGGLLDVLLQGGRTGEPCLVVLEGFNRAPAESYLMPLLECRSDGWSGRAGRAIPVVAPGLLTLSDRHADVTKVGWPSNILLSLIPAPGSASFPVGESLWRHVAVVDCGDGNLDAPESLPREELSIAAPELWAEWRESTRTTARSPIRQILDSLQNAGSPTAAILVTESIYAAASTLSASEEKALELALKTSYLPSLREPPDELVDAVVAQGVPSDQARRLQEFAARLKA
jgi:hypothetical protein